MAQHSREPMTFYEARELHRQAIADWTEAFANRYMATAEAHLKRAQFLERIILDREIDLAAMRRRNSARTVPAVRMTPEPLVNAMES